MTPVISSTVELLLQFCISCAYTLSAFDITRVSIISNLSFSDIIFGHISVRVLKRPRRGIKINVFLCDRSVLVGIRRCIWLKWSYSYFTRIKIRVDTTLYQYDLVCILPEKIKWGRISYLLVFVPYNFYSYSYWSYRIRPRIRYDLIRPGRISDPCPGVTFCLKREILII